MALSNTTSSHAISVKHSIHFRERCAGSDRAGCTLFYPSFTCHRARLLTDSISHAGWLVVGTRKNRLDSNSVKVKGGANLSRPLDIAPRRKVGND